MYTSNVRATEPRPAGITLAGEFYPLDDQLQGVIDATVLIMNQPVIPKTSSRFLAIKVVRLVTGWSLHTAKCLTDLIMETETN